jgi:ArsR family transcriptional regulator
MHEPTKQQLQLAAIFKALGDPTRLRIFEFLRSCCGAVVVDAGGDVRPIRYDDAQSSLPTVGDVCCQITGEQKITSSISFHLKELRQAGLIVMERRGKSFLCNVAPDVQDNLANYFGGKLTEECCGCESSEE